MNVPKSRIKFLSFLMLITPFLSKLNNVIKILNHDHQIVQSYVWPTKIKQTNKNVSSNLQIAIKSKNLHKHKSKSLSIIPKFKKLVLQEDERIGYNVQDPTDLFEEGLYCLELNKANSRSEPLNPLNNSINLDCRPEMKFHFMRVGSRGDFRIISNIDKKDLTEKNYNDLVKLGFFEEWKNSPNQRWQLIFSQSNDPNKPFIQIKNSTSKFMIEYKVSENKTEFYSIQKSEQFFSIILVKIYEPIELKQIFLPKRNQINFEVQDFFDFDSRGIYCILNVKSNKAMMINSDNDYIVQRGNECSDPNLFRILRFENSNYFVIQNSKTNKVLATTDFHLSKQPIKIEEFENKTHQLWRFFYRNDDHRSKNEMQIINVKTNHTLDVFYGSINDNAEIIAWVDNHLDPNERWRFRLIDFVPGEIDENNNLTNSLKNNEIGYIVENETDLINNGIYCFFNIKSNKNISSNFKNDKFHAVQGNENDCTENEIFKIFKFEESENYYYIKNEKHQKVLTVTSNPSKDYDSVILDEISMDKSITNFQKWSLKFRTTHDKKNKEIQLINAQNKTILDVLGQNINNNADIIASTPQHNYIDSEPNKKWKMKLVQIGKPETPFYEKIGYIVDDIRFFLDDGIYCISAMNSHKKIGMSTNLQDPQVYQIGKECNDRFKFRVENIGNEEFGIRDINQRGAWTQEKGKIRQNSIRLNEWKNLPLQRWKLSFLNSQDKKEGKIQISNLTSKRWMDVHSGNTNDGLPLANWHANVYQLNQKFTFELVDIKPNLNLLKNIKQKDEIGYIVNDPSNFLDNGVYCMKNLHDNLPIGYIQNLNNQVAQSHTSKNECSSDDLKVRVVKMKEYFRIFVHSQIGTMSIEEIEKNEEPIKFLKWENKKSQKWKIIFTNDEKKKKKEMTLLNAENGYTFNQIIDANSDKNLFNVLKENHATPNQLFKFTLVEILHKFKNNQIGYIVEDLNDIIPNGVYNLEVQNSKKFIGLGQEEDDPQIYQIGNESNLKFQYRFVKIESDSYRIVNLFKNQDLTETRTRNVAGIVRTAPYEGLSKQKWKIFFKNDSQKKAKQFTIMNRNSNWTLDVDWKKPDDGRIIWTYKNHNSLNQRFLLKLIELVNEKNINIQNVDYSIPDQLEINVGEKNRSLASLEEISAEGIYCIKILHSARFFSFSDKNQDLIQNNFQCHQHERFQILKQQDKNEYMIKNITKNECLYVLRRDSLAQFIRFQKCDSNKIEQKFIFDFFNEDMKKRRIWRISSVKTKQVFKITNGYRQRGSHALTWVKNINNPEQRIELTLFQDLIPKLKKNEIGYIVEEINHFLENGIYCIRNEQRSKNLSLSNDLNNNQIYQVKEEDCDENSQFRVIRMNETNNFRILSVKNKKDITQIHINNTSPILRTFRYEKNRNQIWKIYFLNDQNKTKRLFTILNQDLNLSFNIISKHQNNSEPENLAYTTKNEDGPNQKFIFELVGFSDEEVIKYPKKLGISKPGRIIENLSELNSRGIYCIQLLISGKYVGIAENENKLVLENGYTCGENEKFKISKTSARSRYYRIESVIQNKFMTSIENKDNGLIRVELDEWKNLNSQKWTIEFESKEMKKERILRIKTWNTNLYFSLNLSNKNIELENTKTFKENQKVQIKLMEYLPNFKHKKNSKGYIVASDSEFENNLIYCIKNSYSKKPIGVMNNEENIVVQHYFKMNRCPEHMKMRIIRILGKETQSTPKYKIENLENKTVLTLDEENGYAQFLKWEEKNSQLFYFSFENKQSERGRLMIIRSKNGMYLGLKNKSSKDNEKLIAKQNHENKDKSDFFYFTNI